jgi:hypothetical protein
MDTNHHSVERCSGSRPGWIVVNGTRVIMHCTDKDEADRIALELCLTVYEKSIPRLPEYRQPAPHR